MTCVRYDLALTSLTQGAGPALSTFTSVPTSSGCLLPNLLPTNLLGEIEAEIMQLLEDGIR